MNYCYVLSQNQFNISTQMVLMFILNELQINIIELDTCCYGSYFDGSENAMVRSDGV